MSLLAESLSPVPLCLSNFIPSPEAVACMPESVARRLLCVPIARNMKGRVQEEELLIASAHREDAILHERVSRQMPLNMQVRFVLADESAIVLALEKCYSGSLMGRELLAACSNNASSNLIQQLEINVSVQLVEAILLCACRERASDIHLSPCVDGVRVRYRIDGLLCEQYVLRDSFYVELVGRIKILAQMDIAITRQPQDGQFSQLIDNELVDFRTSLFPLVKGENTVIRVLRPRQSQRGVGALELPEKVEGQLLSCLQEPSGLIVFCGPTGSGKSSSIHALLSELDQTSLNIMTLEDPVEQHSPGIQQTSIDSARSLGYAEGLRAVMRQDPDVLLIGEVRDSSSCQMMLRAVMTGHSVLTTVHAKNVFGAIDRLIELGVSREMLASHLLCIAAQRLIRKRCSQCSGVNKKCLLCGGGGYFGRQAIVELLVITSEIAELISSCAERKIVLGAAQRLGFVSLHEQVESLIFEPK